MSQPMTRSASSASQGFQLSSSKELQEFTKIENRWASQAASKGLSFQRPQDLGLGQLTRDSFDARQPRPGSKPEADTDEPSEEERAATEALALPMKRPALAVERAVAKQESLATARYTNPKQIGLGLISQYDDRMPPQRPDRASAKVPRVEAFDIADFDELDEEDITSDIELLVINAFIQKIRPINSCPEASGASQSQALGGQVKRRKVAQACGQCRVKKTRCNGEQDCQECTKRSSLCIYATPEDKKRQKVNGLGAGPSSSNKRSASSTAHGKKRAVRACSSCKEKRTRCVVGAESSSCGECIARGYVCSHSATSAEGEVGG